MKHPLPLLSLFLLSAVGVFPQSQKDMIKGLERDILDLREKIALNQKSQDEKLENIKFLVQQILESSHKANIAVGVLDGAMRDRLKDQEKLLVAPVAGVGARVETMSNDFAGVREAVTDLSSRMGKLQNQIADINTAIKILAAPPAPPPAAVPSASNPHAPPPGVSAETLYNGGMRDKSAGNSDLAVEQFENYLKWFGNTDLAPNAQYYIGEIKYLRGDLDGALLAFDTLLEKYPDNPKTSDAMLQKGRALVKSGFKAEARQEFTSLIKKFPTHDNASKAKTEIAALNSASRAPARATKKN